MHWHVKTFHMFQLCISNITLHCNCSDKTTIERKRVEINHIKCNCFDKETKWESGRERERERELTVRWWSFNKNIHEMLL